MGCGVWKVGRGEWVLGVESGMWGVGCGEWGEGSRVWGKEGKATTQGCDTGSEEGATQPSPAGSAEHSPLTHPEGAWVFIQ